MPFTNAYHGEAPEERLDLAARIDAELRTRIEDAVDYTCLDAMVRAREERRAPAPVADNADDRQEYVARVEGFLERLRRELVSRLDAEQQRRLGDALAAPAGGDVAAAVRVQVTLAKELPDYWQRFEAVRATPAAAEPAHASGRQGRGLLDRLLGR